MRNYPLTAKEQHKRKEKLAKIRQTDAFTVTRP